MTDSSDTWAAKWRRFNSKPDRVRARYVRFCEWLNRNQLTAF